MLIHFDGNGNYNVLAADEDLAGIITQDATWQSTYTVQSNGVASLSQPGHVPIPCFLYATNRCFLIGMGNNTVFGMSEPQTGGPFSLASVNGSYVAGALPPMDYDVSQNQILTGSGNGAGTTTFGGDGSDFEGLDQWFGLHITYTMAANGRGTGLAQGDETPSIVYMISPTKFLVMMSEEEDARMVVFEH
jgi:hypothetical protein